MTQNERLLSYLHLHNGITTLEAMQHLKILRVSERIRELEKKGYSFSHDIEHTENARVVRYRLLKAAPQVHSRMESPAMLTPSPAVAATYKSWMHG